MTFGPNSITGGDWGADDDTSAPHTASEPVPAAPTPLPHTTTGTTGVTGPPSGFVAPCCNAPAKPVACPDPPCAGAAGVFGAATVLTGAEPGVVGAGPKGWARMDWPDEEILQKGFELFDALYLTVGGPNG